jgi:PEP-CTERM motif
MRKSLRFTSARKTSFAGAAVRISIIALACLFLSASGARADTFTYTYTGNDFTTVTGPYTTSDKVTGIFVLSEPIPPSLLNLTDESALVLSYSISDGVQKFSGPPPSLSAFTFETAPGGEITEWLIGTGTDPLNPGGAIFSENAEIHGTFDVGRMVGPPFTSGFTDLPGSWAGPVENTVPEPGTVSMMFSGLLGLGLLVGVKRYRGNRLATIA